MERAPALAVAFTLASLPFLLPHVIEDFHLGIAGRVGLPADVGASFLGFGLAAQLLGLVLTAQGRRAGLAILAVASTVWTARLRVGARASAPRGGPGLPRPRDCPRCGRPGSS